MSEVPGETRAPKGELATQVSPTALGITLMGVIVSIGVSVGFGVEAAWPIRVGAAVTSIVVLGAVVKASTQSGHGRLARLADWLVTGSRSDRPAG